MDKMKATSPSSLEELFEARRVLQDADAYLLGRSGYGIGHDLISKQMEAHRRACLLITRFLESRRAADPVPAPEEVQG